MENGLTWKTVDVNLSTCRSKTSLGVYKEIGGICSIGTSSGKLAGDEAVDDMEIGESTDILKDDC